MKTQIFLMIGMVAYVLQCFSYSWSTVISNGEHVSIKLNTVGGPVDTYRIILAFSNRACNKTLITNTINSTLFDTNNETVDVSHDPSSVNLIDKIIGPDEIYIQIEGPTLQAFIPKYYGCGTYKYDFGVNSESVYHIKVVRMRSNYMAIKETVAEFPKLIYETLVSDWIILHKIQSNLQCIYHFPHGVWKMNNYSLAIYHNLSLDYFKSLTPLTLLDDDPIEKFDLLDLVGKVHLHVNLTTHWGPQHCVKDIDLYTWSPDGCNWEYIHQPEAAALFRGKKIAIQGDSHARVLGNSLLKFVCKIETDNKLKHPSYPIGLSECNGLIFHYLEGILCEDAISGKTFDYDLFLINCGHHPAALEVSIIFRK
jgi:hypothetical protein